MSKVYEFSLDVSYGSGVCLIASETEEDAIELARSMNHVGSIWEFEGERTDIQYVGGAVGDELPYCFFSWSYRE